MRFTLTADYAPSYTLYVNVEVTDCGSFLTGTIPSVITIASGTRTSDLILETDNDSVDEPHGTITAKINSGSNYLLGSPSSASMRVFDNAAAPVIPILSISADSTPVTEGSYVTFRVRANRAPSTLLYINVNTTENGQFLDEVPVTEITMDAGATETLYILRTENDSTDEPNGSVTGNLDTGTTYTINTSTRSAVVEVLDNDLPRPPAPEGFEVTFADSDSISLAWDRLPGASSYRVRHSLSGGTAGRITGSPFPGPSRSAGWPTTGSTTSRLRREGTTPLTTMSWATGPAPLPGPLPKSPFPIWAARW